MFSGYGGLDAAVQSVAGGTVAWVSDIDPGPAKILAHHWPDVPNLGDITEVDFTAVEPVDVLTGGFPCQDVSHAGRRQGLIRDGDGRTRSGLWGEMLRAINEQRPALVVAENVRGLLSAQADSDMEPCPWCLGGASDGGPMRALGAVLADLADIGYDAAWCGLRAADVGAPHGRFRVFITAWPADTDLAGLEGAEPAPRHVMPAGSSREHLTLMPTPRATDGTKGGPNQRGSSGDLMLPSAVTLLPTPLVGSTSPAAHGQISGDYRARMAQALANWGEYAPTIARWEAVLGRPAPAPTEPTGRDGAHRLSPRFVEWLMGLPEGHVTAVPGLTRNAQLKALGNGVVPQQATAALTHLLAQEVAA